MTDNMLGPSPMHIKYVYWTMYAETATMDQYLGTHDAFRKHINSLLKRKWQSQWDETANNKLHAIHSQLGLWPGDSRIIRREESVLARVRIGHTHLTHCFLLKGEDPPQCTACDCQLTVKHFFYLSVLIL